LRGFVAREFSIFSDSLGGAGPNAHSLFASAFL
jgi:hypothetical protein